MRGAVHTNLLYVVTDTTGRSGFDGSTDGPSGALARTDYYSRLAVVALLLLLGLLSCVVFMVFLIRCGSCEPDPDKRLGAGHIAFEFAHSRFHFVNEPDIFVVPDHAGLRVVIRVPDGGGTQTELAQVGGFYAEHAQRHRQREKCHAK